MDIASPPWLNPTMRSGFLALCGFVAFILPGVVRAQSAVPPTIIAQPQSAPVFVGQPATMSATIDGTAPLAYQWYKDGAPLAGATDASFTLTSAALSDNLPGYYLIASNSAGAVTTTVATFNVSQRPQSIAFAPAVTSTNAGTGLTLSATSTFGLPVTFSIVSGAASLNGNVLTSPGGTVIVRASQAGTAGIAAATPVERTFTFIAGGLSPFITAPPADQTVTAGASVTFRVSAIGTPLPTYQWQKDGVALEGATSATFTLPVTAVADSARYTVIATNFAGTASASATLTVRAPPAFTSEPAPQAVSAGDTVVFTAAATGSPAPTFQWRKNGVALAGATNSTLRFASAAATDAARYDVIATNILGSVTSGAATLTVATRDFGGTYFGAINSTINPVFSGDFALLVRPNRTAVFLGQVVRSAIVVPDLVIDLRGGFVRPIAIGATNVTLRGQIDETTGLVTATLSDDFSPLVGVRSERTGATAALAGLYQFAVVGSATARGYALVAADARAFVLATDGTAADAAQGRVGSTSRLTLTTANQTAFDLTFSNGVLTGTLSAGGVTSSVRGAIESLLGTEHLTNLSVRSQTSNGNPLITGFVIGGTVSKQVLIRAAGPAIGQAPFNVPGALADPTLQLFRGNLAVGQNDEWGTPAANGVAVTAATARTGAFAFRTGSADAALVATLPAGAYTVTIGGGNGTVLAEIYEVPEAGEIAGARRLANTSARGVVSPGNPLIVGFVIAGTMPQRVLLRGIGPALGNPPFNLPGALGNPQLTVFRGAAAVKTNDDWFRDPEAATIRTTAARVGAFALGAQSSDAAILLYLEPGAYTAQVSGPTGANNNNGTGLALVEVYEAAP